MSSPKNECVNQKSILVPTETNENNAKFDEDFKIFKTLLVDADGVEDVKVRANRTRLRYNAVSREGLGQSLGQNGASTMAMGSISRGSVIEKQDEMDVE